jgi:RND family efflux transporter MFP subunit
MSCYHVRWLLLPLLGLSYALQAEVTKVTVISPPEETHTQKLVLTGTVLAKQDANLSSLEQGLIKTILVEVGDHVTQGQTLLTLDNTLAKIELEQAQAIQLSAKIQYQEAQRLHKEVLELAQKQVVANTLSAERNANRANTKALLARATAEVALQQEVVNRHVLIAPFTGVIAQRNVDIGEWVNQQNGLLQLVSDSHLRLLVDIPQEHLHTLQGQRNINATVFSDIDKSLHYSLPLSQLVAVSDPLSRTVQGRIDLPKTNAFIPGMSARAEFLLPKKNAKQMLLPKSALKRHPDGSYSVYSVVDKKVKRHSIIILQHLGEQVSVSGVPTNAAIIISGNELLTEGTVVEVSSAMGNK